MAKPTPKPTQKRIPIEFPKDLEATYANMAFISHTPAEFVIDFAQVLPRTPKGHVKSRVVMSPMHTRMFIQALQQNIANFEKQFGEIRMPQSRSLADELFRFPQSGPGDDDESEE